MIDKHPGIISKYFTPLYCAFINQIILNKADQVQVDSLYPNNYSLNIQLVFLVNVQRIFYAAWPDTEPEELPARLHHLTVCF